jgi:hypothetical protein
LLLRLQSYNKKIEYCQKPPIFFLFPKKCPLSDEKGTDPFSSRYYLNVKL